MNALTTQVGGDHYRNKAIQPVELAHVRGYDCFIFSVLKYVTRHPEKQGEQDLRKAQHFIRLRQHLFDTVGVSVIAKGCSDDIPLTAAQYVVSNNLPPAEAAIIVLNDQWHENPHDRVLPDLLFDSIETLIHRTYGDKR